MKKIPYIHDDIILYDADFFGDENGHQYSGTFSDGTAVLNKSDKEDNAPEKVILSYPTLEDLTEDQIDDIRSYCGLSVLDELNYHDVALTFGTLNGGDE